MNNDTITAEVLETSKRWIESFNRSDVKACTDKYTKSAIMHARPMGSFEGREAIYEFWNNFMSSTDAGNLIYSNSEIEVIDQNSAILSSQWSMNVGKGFIAKELWVKEGNEWYLYEDDFTVEEQF